MDFLSEINVDDDDDDDDDNEPALPSGPSSLSALNLLNDLGRKISSVSGDDRGGHFLFQRLSVILQRYNAVLLHESFVQSDGLDL